MRSSVFEALYKSKDFIEGKDKGFPYIVDVELTNECNLSCNFCSRSIMTRKKGYMDFGSFKHIVDECAKYNTPIRFIRFGEPFLHPRILEYLEYAKRYVPVHITTNGQLLTEKICRELIRLRLNSIIFSFQGESREDYERARHADYFELLKNINMLVYIRGNYLRPFIQVTTTTPTGKEQFKIKGVDKISIGKTNWAYINNEYTDEQKGCMELYQKLSVNYDQSVSACCGDYDNLMEIGHLSRQTLKEIWDSDILSAYRKIIKEEKFRSLTLCKSCVRNA